MKRLISIITAAVMMCTGLIGAMPANAQEITNAKTASLDSDISVEGTNSFGNLLSSELDSEVAEQEENNGYNVFSAEVTGTEVAVSFETMSDCTLLAAIYDEAGETLIASGTAQVNKEETEKTVTIETDEMPQYFYLMVYLVDETTMRPMCTAYESPNYTQEMQEFFALTVNDFDSDRVLNLDEDETNNFAVYSDETIIIESDETVNTVTTADIDNENYVIENADSTVTSLQAGDIFVIEQTSGEVLIVKVGEITVDGTTVTITGEDAEMEEVFEIVKIDTTQTNEEATIDTSSMSEGVTYEGETNEIQALTAQTKNNSGSDTTTSSLKFSFKFLEGKSDDGSTSVSLSGSVSLSSALNLKYYISWSRQYVEVKFDNTLNFSVALSGSMEKEFELGTVDFHLCPGLYVSVVPKIVFEFSMTASFNFTIEKTEGFSVEHTNKGFKKQNLGEKPVMSASIKLEGTLSVGVAIAADICLVHRKIFRAGFEASAKLELSLEETTELATSEKNPDSKHTCKVCFEGDLSVKTEISFNVTFLDSKKLSLKWVLASKKVKLKDVYFSVDHLTGGFTTCPYYSYRTDFKIYGSDGSQINDAELKIRDAYTNTYLENIVGTKNIYLQGGKKYSVTATAGSEKISKMITVKKAPQLLTLRLEPFDETSQPTTEPVTTAPVVETTTTTTDSSVVASGTCGEHLTWVLDDEGTLTISGTGEMENYIGYWLVPWYEYRDNITNVIIEGGVTSIGYGAFYYCISLNKIIIPDSVTNIGGYAFALCESLTSIRIHENVTNIGERVFSCCYSLTVIDVEKTNAYYTSVDGVLFDKSMSKLIQFPSGKTNKEYIIPDGVTSIGDDAFYFCDSLSEISIPDSVTSIGNYAFHDCDELTTITIPDSVISIGNEAFASCYSLTSIDVESANKYYTSIDGVLFDKSISKLIQYPSGKTDKGYIILDSVMSIAGYAFFDCDSLITITIPNSVANIGDNAFFSCDALTDVYYTGTEEQWNEITIDSGNEDLTDATIHYNSTGGTSTASLLTMTKNSAEGTTLLTESFTDLLPNEVYNFYVMKSRAAESPFSGENLLYVTQAVSDENGGLTISYIPKEAFETADIFVAGLTRTDISAATVTVPEITYTGGEILAKPEVTLNGQALTEGIDYDIEGGYLVTRPDEYTITISGTGDYTGSVDVTFTAVCGHNYDGKACTICGAENPDYVEPTEPTEDKLLGDVDNDGAVNASDASKVLTEYAIIATCGTPTFSEEQTKAADVNADGATDAIDASSILGYYAYIATGGSGTIEEYLN